MLPKEELARSERESYETQASENYQSNARKGHHSSSDEAYIEDEKSKKLIIVTEEIQGN